jgi:hypothetical protein
LLSLQDAVQPERGQAPVPSHVTGPFSDLRFETPDALDREIHLVDLGARQHAFLAVAASRTMALTGFGHGLHRDGVLKCAGSGSLVVRGGGAGALGARLQLKTWCLLGNLNELDTHCRFAAALDDSPFGMDAPGVSVVVSRHDTRLIEWKIGDRHEKPGPLQVGLHSAHIPIADASAASSKAPGPDRLSACA